MPVKKTAKVKAAANKTTTGKRRGRPPGSKNKPKDDAAPKRRGRPPGSKNKTKPVSKPANKKREAPVREKNEATGFVVGSDQDLIATELLAGGESRAEIAERLEGILEPTTRNDTPKQIVNMVAGVLNKLLDRGYTVEQSFVVVPPTPASKRAASRAANKKATAKPATTGKRRGRPPGSKNKPKEEAPKRRGRPPGSKNKPKTGAAAKKGKK